MHRSTSFKTHSLYQLINDATDNLLRSENEELNKRICSEILRTSDGPKVAAKILNKIITKSLSNHSFQSIWYCLLLLDLAVKGTDLRFCTAILAKEFFVDLTKVMDPKNQVPDFVQEKFLYLIKEWNESLTSVPGHNNLAKFYKNQMSPPVASTTSPGILKAYPVEPSTFTYFPSHMPSNCGFHDKNKILRDIEVIETNLSMFSDTLRTVNAGEMSNEESQFLKDLHDAVKKMQVRINEIIPMCLSEDIVNQLLQVNDKINSTSERYIRLMATVTKDLLVTVDPRSRHTPAISETRDSTYAMPTNVNTNRVIPDLYDVPSLPSYIEASSHLSKINRTQPSQEVNLINFDDEGTQCFYNTCPLPSIPASGGKDLLTEPIAVTTDTSNHMTSDEFDTFIESIARRHQPTATAGVHSNEEYAPPLYDEAVPSTTNTNNSR